MPTTIPQVVRAALGLNDGDVLADSIEDGQIVPTKAPTGLPRKGDPLSDPFATFLEWDSQEGAEDFADL